MTQTQVEFSFFNFDVPRTGYRMYRYVVLVCGFYIFTVRVYSVQYPVPGSTTWYAEVQVAFWSEVCKFINERRPGLPLVQSQSVADAMIANVF